MYIYAELPELAKAPYKKSQSDIKSGIFLSYQPL